MSENAQLDDRIETMLAKLEMYRAEMQAVQSDIATIRNEVATARRKIAELSPLKQLIKDGREETR